MVGDYIFENLYANGIEDHKKFGAILNGLKTRGFTKEEMSQILGLNFLRVSTEVWSQERKGK